MASLEHFNQDGRDCYRLRFLVDKRRQFVGLTGFDEAAAMIAKEHVEHLIAQRRLGRSPKPPTSRWLDSLPIEIHDRLAKIGLTEARSICELPRTTIAFMTAYIKSRSDWKKPENYRQAVDKLKQFIKRDVPLSSITKGDVERWQRWMIQTLKLSPNTAGQNVKRCRQMMRQAVDDGLLERNPFAGVKIDLRSDTSKDVFIDADATIAILEACPDQEYRTLFALCRFGGLRCPSEVLRMRWTDIQWDRGRMKVTAPKTERYGKGERIVPLFPELRSELDALFAIVAPGVTSRADGYVINRYRSSESNLRTTFLKVVGRAGLASFAKPFMALRASRRTELERTGRFPNHVLNDWFGHSGAIAETHYLRTTEADFTEASGSEARSKPSARAAKPTNPTDDRAVGTFVGTSPRGRETSISNPPTKKPRKNGALTSANGARFGQKYTGGNTFREDSLVEASSVRPLSTLLEGDYHLAVGLR